MTMIEFKTRCPHCGIERSLAGPYPASNPAELDALEHAVTRKTFIARCLKCNAVEDVAMFVDGVQAEPWTNADEYERQSGRDAGPLPPKPWPDTN